jgi:hypothetical protein
MTTAMIFQVILLWAAVFVGLDLAFGEGVLTHGIDEALQRALKWLRELMRS